MALGGAVTSPADLCEKLERVFPPEEFRGLVAAHDCEQCDAIRRTFSHRRWTDILDAELDAHDDVLALLTPEAYCTFLPTWIRRGLREPERGVATLALINMEATEHVDSFTALQRTVLLECVQYIHQSDPFRVQDDESIREIESIRRRWAS